MGTVFQIMYSGEYSTPYRTLTTYMLVILQFYGCVESNLSTAPAEPNTEGRCNMARRHSSIEKSETLSKRSTPHEKNYGSTFPFCCVVLFYTLAFSAFVSNTVKRNQLDHGAPFYLIIITYDIIALSNAKF